MKQKIFIAKELSLVGLNLQAVINIKDLPVKITQQLSAHSTKLPHYTQLVLIGHAGKVLWEQVKLWEKSNHQVIEDRIDQFSDEQVDRYFNKHFSKEDFELVFPYSNSSLDHSNPLGLQTLGEIASWHHSSPFKVGINSEWGSWFAYRAVVLIKSHFETNTSSNDNNELSPCVSCVNKPCISACPANALKANEYELKACIDYRKQDASRCKDRCLARMACPISKENQYSLEQIQYHYSLSMKTIEKYASD